MTVTFELDGQEFVSQRQADNLGRLNKRPDKQRGKGDVCVCGNYTATTQISCDRNISSGTNSQ